VGKDFQKRDMVSEHKNAITLMVMQIVLGFLRDLVRHSLAGKHFWLEDKNDFFFLFKALVEKSFFGARVDPTGKRSE
jgi:hypothetical protein